MHAENRQTIKLKQNQKFTISAQGFAFEMKLNASNPKRLWKNIRDGKTIQLKRKRNQTRKKRIQTFNEIYIFASATFNLFPDS